MARHFYAIPSPSQTTIRQNSNIVVGTSTDATAAIEVAVTDGVLTARQCYAALEYMADLFARRESGQVIVPGTLIG